jgi:putative FmdB family regulatory protein
MPTYEFLCRKCGAEFSLTMTIKEREAATITCEKCRSTELEPLLGPFFAKTSKKS